MLGRKADGVPYATHTMFQTPILSLHGFKTSAAEGGAPQYVSALFSRDCASPPHGSHECSRWDTSLQRRHFREECRGTARRWPKKVRQGSQARVTLAETFRARSESVALARLSPEGSKGCACCSEAGCACCSEARARGGEGEGGAVTRLPQILRNGSYPLRALTVVPLQPTRVSPFVRSQPTSTDWTRQLLPASKGSMPPWP